MNDFPKCKAQKEFEDLAKELIKVLATLPEAKQIDVFEYLQTVAFRNKHEQN